MGAATLKDVANLAEVSTATVSYVLNDGPRPVSAETRQRVLDAMHQLSYQPRRKRKQNSSTAGLTMGIIVPSSNSTFFGGAVEGIETFLYGRGHRCLVASSWEDQTIERQLIRKLAKLCDGFIITPAAGMHRGIAGLQAHGIPTVIMDRLGTATNFNGVAIDNYQISAQAVKLLFNSHHETIALINGPEDMAPIQRRLQGYKDTLHELNLSYNPEWVHHVPFTEEAGRNAALDLMSSHNPPGAIICAASDNTTVGILQSFTQLGVTLSDDVALVSYGDTNWTSLLTPAITVIDAPTFLMGETSARLLLNLISNPTQQTEPRHILLEPKPILRDSHNRPRTTVQSAVYAPS